MYRFAPLMLLALPALAHAGDECRHQSPRTLAPDLSGVRSVELRVGGHDFRVRPAGDGHAAVSGRACASSPELLQRLQLVQHREGDRLVIAADRMDHDGVFNLFGFSRYAYLDVDVALPPGMPLTISVGSGDGDVAGMSEVNASVGSGDLHVRGIGRLVASVGSGDLKASDIGSVEVGSVGSGDFDATGVSGDARVGRIGSGDVRLRRIGGSVDVDRIGSGDLVVDDVRGDLAVAHVGSGDVHDRGVAGRVDVPRDD